MRPPGIGNLAHSAGQPSLNHVPIIGPMPATQAPAWTAARAGVDAALPAHGSTGLCHCLRPVPDERPLSSIPAR